MRSRFLAVLGFVLWGWGTTFSAETTLTGDTNRPEMSVFVQNDEVNLLFKIDGIAPDVKEEKLRIDITDAHGRPVSQETVAVAPDSKGRCLITLKAPAQKLGFYRVAAKLANGTTIPALGKNSDRPAGFLTYAVVVDPAKRKLYPAAQTVFGMQGGFNRKIQVLPYLGIRWVLGPGNWGNMEPDYPGQFADRYRAAIAKGQKFPEDPYGWCRYKVDGQEKPWTTYFMSNGMGTCCLPTKWKVPPYKPETFAIGRGVLSAEGEKQFENYCRAYAKAIAENFPEMDQHLYEITWEPELFWKGTPEELVRYYQIAYPAIHEQDPKAVVMGAAVHEDYIKTLFDAGIGKYLDAFSMHYGFIGEGFERKAPAHRIRKLRELIRASCGKDLPLVNSEFGMNTEAVDGPELLRSSQQEIRAHLISLGEGFRHLIAFYITAAGGGYFYNLDPNSGCGTGKTSPRPVAPAYAAMTYLLEGHKGVEAIEWMGESALGYVYENTEDVTLALWDYSESGREVTLPVGVAKARVYDWMGNLSEIETVGGVLKLTLGNDPVYVQGVSPKLWGSGAEKPLTVSGKELSLFPNDEGTVNCTVRAFADRPLVGTVSARTGEFLSLTRPEAGVSLPAGGSGEFQFQVKVAPGTPAGTYPVSLFLRAGDVVAGAGGCVVRINEPLKVGRMMPLTGADGSRIIQFTMEELRGQAATGHIQLRFLGVPESAKEVPFTLEPRQKKTFAIAFAELAIRNDKKYSVQMQVRLDSGYSFGVAEETDFLVARHLAQPPVINGDATKWANVPAVELNGLEWCLRSPQYYSGDAAKVRYGWDENALYLLVESRDEVFLQEQTDARIWMDDSLQCGFCLEPFKEFQATSDAFADSFNRPMQAEINLALTTLGPLTMRALVFPKNDKRPCGRLSTAECPTAIIRKGNLTTYELAIPWATLGLEKAPKAGDYIGVTIAVNDRDTRAQKDTSALSLFNGATAKKDPALMGLLRLEK